MAALICRDDLVTARDASRGRADIVCCTAAERQTMERSEVIAKLKRHEAELKRLGVEHLYLFGGSGA